MLFHLQNGYFILFHLQNGHFILSVDSVGVHGLDLVAGHSFDRTMTRMHSEVSLGRCSAWSSFRLYFFWFLLPSLFLLVQDCLFSLWVLTFPKSCFASL